RASPVDGLNYLFLGWNGRTLGRSAERDSLSAVAWLIPYCARHHPLQSETQRVPGTLSASFTQGGGRLGWPSLRASTEHSIRLGPERINPECAVREHNGQPCRPAPLSCVRDARAREATCPPSPARHVRDARTRGISLAAPPSPPFASGGLLIPSPRIRNTAPSLPPSERL